MPWGEVRGEAERLGGRLLREIQADGGDDSPSQGQGDGDEDKDKPEECKGSGVLGSIG